jgi:hypothetical protein
VVARGARWSAGLPGVERANRRVFAGPDRAPTLLRHPVMLRPGLTKFALAAVALGVTVATLSNGCGGASGSVSTVGGGTSLCAQAGSHCASDVECCSGGCDPQAGSCVGGAPINCEAAGARCTTSLECCSLSCEGGLCATQACASDGLACTSGAECCSGTCSAGACKALSNACKTSGNACAQSSECCSQLCKSGRCSTASSFCIQNGDTCAQGPDCCGGVCTIAAGGTLGTCGGPPAGATFCNGGVDGTVCSACGDCCSRLCAPYGTSGVKVCQPAEGCRIDGDLCSKDADCCGAAGSGLPGDGNVVCEIQAGFSVGICRNPTGCNPEGNVCHYKDYACANSSARNDCCGAPGNSGACELDALGVPRCHAVGACASPGGACAFAADCCGGGHCVPGPDGKLACQTTCSPMGGSCTASADCCAGLPCIAAQGSTSGVCGTSPPPGETGPPAQACALYGQACAQDSDCCSSVPCTTTTGVACGGATGCTCVEPPTR